MNNAYLLIGGNMGDREKSLAMARKRIEEVCGVITAASSVYETAAWGKTDQPAFLNQALELKTAFPATELIEILLDIEKKLGRVRQEKYGSRIIDVDILLFNDEIIATPSLRVPHPELQQRRFALAPLADIAPYIFHPVLKKTITRLLEECPDDLAVRKIRA